MELILQAPDPTDHGAFSELADVYLRSKDRRIDLPWLPPELQVILAGDDYVRTDVVQARLGDEVVAVGWADLPERDNTSVGYIEIAVPPEHRRNGYGTAILDWLAARVLEDGRDTLLGETVRAADEETGPGREFALARGFAFDTLNAQRELLLPSSQPPAEPRDGYTLQSWRGEPPAGLIDDYATLRALLNTEAPSGQTGLENEFWDAERLRLEVDQWWRQRRTAQTVVALAPDGTLAGHTQLLFPAKSTVVYQWDTLVLPEHRGHGLGLALKREAMHAADELLEGRERIVTWNDAANEPMIRVNTELGYRLSAFADQWAKKLN